ncbi:MAG: Flagellar hook-length control protein FliK [Gemmatimonadetes bacterium]|nr:Flagellar hook-length control protein FliK [Gemmatimonadota bacterium]
MKRLNANFGGIFASGQGGGLMQWNAQGSSISAGASNSIPGENASAFGASNSVGGSASFAAGRNLTVTGGGSIGLGTYVSPGNSGFAFGDNSSGGTNNLTGDANSFVARAAGGVFFYTSGDLSTGASLAPGSGSWSTLSNVRAKTAFRSEDPEFYLRGIAGMSLASWQYRKQNASIRHIGPTAQDFRAAFGMGENDTTISMVDADGVNMIAIKALAIRTDSLKSAVSELQALRTENLELKKKQREQDKRMAAIEAMLRRTSAPADSTARSDKHR